MVLGSLEQPSTQLVVNGVEVVREPMADTKEVSLEPRFGLSLHQLPKTP